MNPPSGECLTGACLCGAVQYAISSRPLLLYHCHCTICQAASGAGYATNIAVRFDSLSFARGESSLASYESSPGKRRYFCAACGSPVYSRASPSSQLASVRCGTLRHQPDMQPSFHAYVRSKLPWVVLADGLPQFDGASPMVLTPTSDRGDPPRRRGPG
jgi:hypothetical protein